MSILFSNAKIGYLDLSNRLIRTASHEGLADSRGCPTQEQCAFYRGFVDGGIGFAKMVAETGCCDAIEFSCGTNEGGFIMARC